MANHLDPLGGKDQDLSPLVLEKSIWFTISALSVLKLGAAMVPLDPRWPNERWMYVIEARGIPGIHMDHIALAVANANANTGPYHSPVPFRFPACRSGSLSKSAYTCWSVERPGASRF
jgi:acyl-CoA synthetase (AMP-forming)/AMP-acid ligase II